MLSRKQLMLESWSTRVIIENSPLHFAISHCDHRAVDILLFEAITRCTFLLGRFSGPKTDGSRIGNGTRRFTIAVEFRESEWSFSGHGRAASGPTTIGTAPKTPKRLRQKDRDDRSFHRNRESRFVKEKYIYIRRIVTAHRPERFCFIRLPALPRGKTYGGLPTRFRSRRTRIDAVEPPYSTHKSFVGSSRVRPHHVLRSLGPRHDPRPKCVSDKYNTPGRTPLAAPPTRRIRHGVIFIAARAVHGTQRPRAVRNIVPGRF